jgi:hypothetical protein
MVGVSAKPGERRVDRFQRTGNAVAGTGLVSRFPWRWSYWFGTQVAIDAGFVAGKVAGGAVHQGRLLLQAYPRLQV